MIDGENCEGMKEGMKEGENCEGMKEGVKEGAGEGMKDDGMEQ